MNQRSVLNVVKVQHCLCCDAELFQSLVVCGINDFMKESVFARGWTKSCRTRTVNDFRYCIYQTRLLVGSMVLCDLRCSGYNIVR